MIISDVSTISIKKEKIYRSNRFEEWWKVYPKKVGKKDCLKKWKARQLDGIADKLIGDVRRRIHTQKWKDGYIPNPATYINGDRWEDEVEKPEPIRKIKDYDQIMKEKGMLCEKK